ncbi:cell division protein BolA [Steroidobacter denitrificans]|uniref:Cell division protein BolA n=1 Tax=Steroidobacter denitrificans TaxID=465721 RepID=A0A127F8V6_STEDE|nr:BolA family protein [Steroidobacter denitrificans]AMN46852.1 cell division protein BolA [Steroidobacter denitrificans]
MNVACENTDRMTRIRDTLRDALHTDRIDLIDDSHLHAGHAGARDGRGHFRLHIVSDDFQGLRILQRHQLVYRALDALMQTDIHALNITAHTSEEAGDGVRR